MTFTTGLNTGLRALAAARFAMETIGHNVANAATPGYSRQVALLAATRPFGIQRGLQLGTGVRLTSINQVVSEHLENRIANQAGLVGHTATDKDRLSELEGILSQGDGSGLEGLLPGFFDALSRMKADPGAPGLRGSVVSAGKSLAQEFNLVATRTTDLRGATRDEIAGLLDEVNRKATAIAELNGTIASVEFQGQRANDLRDQRGLLVREMSELIPVRTIERDNGAIDVLVQGRLVVAHRQTNQLSSQVAADGTVSIQVQGSSESLTIGSGKLGALLDAVNASISQTTSQVDQLAHELILQINRLHTTGIPRSGPFTSLIAEHAVRDGDGDGHFDDELLGDRSLPFAIAKGTLYLTVTNKASGVVERTPIAIDPENTTLGDLATAITNAGHVTAIVDPTGRLRITAESGYGFDFSTRLDSSPDAFGSFGGGAATVSGTNGGPYAFSVPAAFTLAVDGGAAQTINLVASDFRNPASASADEVAAAVNRQISGATARVIGGRVVIRSATSGSSSSVRATDGSGTPLATLGMASAQTFNGSDLAVAVSVSGRYSGTANNQFRFVADGNGQIGVTNGLKVSVYDQSGARVAQLDVGRGYSPGDPLTVADGVVVRFGPGTISAAAGQSFALDVLADSDTSDVLVGLGLNLFFTGSKASDIDVSQSVDGNPDLLAAGLSDSVGDGDNLTRMIDLRKISLDGLGGRTLEEHEGRIIADIGFAVARASEVATAQESTLSLLESQRDQISGVSIDEEVVNLTRFQQSFEAASRFINVLSNLNQTLLDLVR